MKVNQLVVILGSVALGLGSISASPQPGPLSAAAQQCEDLTNGDFAQVEDAPTQIANATIVPADAGRPAYCRVRGYVWPQVGFELELPVTGWNGKFIEVGCGGACGTLAWTFWCPLQRGYACIVSDMGYQGKDQDGLWAYNNLQAQIDFGYRGAHVVAVAGKAITERYYGQAPSYSYFNGCSTGGRQALVEAQRFPWDFNGIIAGDPWIHDTISTMAFVWMSRVLKDKEGKPLLSRADLRMLHEAVLAKCDLDDGVNDGIISNPLACKFDPQSLRCKTGASTRCLTDSQVDVVRKIYAGPATSAGVRLSTGGAVPGSELKWILEPREEGSPGYIMRDGSLSGLEEWANEYFRWMVLPPAGRSWNVADFDFDRDDKRFESGAQESILSAANPDLRIFKSAGGKLIVYSAWNQSLPRKNIDYYQTVEKTMGGRDATQDFFRLFAVPGMDHCTGGEGAFAIDYLTYLESWVERGEAPNKMIGAHVDSQYLPEHSAFMLTFPLDSPISVNFSRPVYPYPQWAKYKGQGDPKRAENFQAAPRSLP